MDMIAPISEPVNVRPDPEVICPGKGQDLTREQGEVANRKPVPEAESQAGALGPAEVRQWQAASCQLKIKSLLQQWRASEGWPPSPTPPDRRKPFAARLSLRVAWLGDG